MNKVLFLINNGSGKSKTDSLLITNPDNIFYLTGYQLHNQTSGREAFLLLSQKENLFIIDGRLINHVREVLPREFRVVERNYSTSMIRIIEVL